MNPALGKILADGPSNDLILESLLEGVAIVDSSRTIVFANASAAKLLGSDVASIVGRPYDLAFFNYDKSLSESELAVCPINFALSEGAASHMPDAVFVRGDGSEVFVEYVCTPLAEGESITGTLISFQDVTQRREFESAVSEARDAALDAARTKAAFLANVSHEIRTPLSGIVGTANLLGETQLDREQANYVSMLKQSIGSLLETVNDILDFSKIEAGKLRLHVTNFNLKGLIDETMTLYRSGAVSKGLGFTAEIGDGLEGEFRGDAGRLRQIVNNLINNAVKFTEHGSVDIRVRRDERGADLIRFEVSDTGIGISEPEPSALFQAFNQGDASTTRRVGGTGLGLAISRELVAMMDGEIGFDSVPGTGSTFWFTVRLPHVPGFEPFEDVRASEGPSTAFRVLLAEDHEISSEIVRTMLEQSGCRVTVAENGAKAFKFAADREFDLIFMDCQMPDVDGFLAARLIRASHGPNRLTKIVALSAHSEEIERDNCLRAGMDDFLSKPLTRTGLAMVFETHFADHLKQSNLDLNTNLIHHFLNNNVAPEVTKEFLTIEARGETDFVKEIFQTFFKYGEDEVAKIESDLSRSDVSSVKSRAHALKGSSANVGFAKLNSLCAELELAAESSVDVARTASLLKAEFCRLRDEFSKL